MFKNYTNKFSPLWRYAAYEENRVQVHWTYWCASSSVGPRHEGSSSGSNDPIKDLEGQVEQLWTELRRRNRVRAEDGQRINELAADVRRLQDELAKRDLAVDWAINSRSVAWDREAKARARVTELSAALDNLQVYCNTLHEEVHVMYS
jgi:ATP-dependent helicase YprA (DUF1998 family)